ncbi:hypothetical protein [Streptomyces roseoverticillatus]|uniref:Uncharacterized protein n=1 Tax=Streptomyces roseoverticillatus TaxID=66429 RepID=A0ABV3IXN4_9ACTN
MGVMEGGVPTASQLAVHEVHAVDGLQYLGDVRDEQQRGAVGTESSGS